MTAAVFSRHLQLDFHVRFFAHAVENRTREHLTALKVRRRYATDEEDL